MTLYYTVNTSLAYFPIRYIDQAGKEQVDICPGVENSGEASQEFESAHTNAYYLTQSEFDRRLENIASERALLASWIGGGK